MGYLGRGEGLVVHAAQCAVAKRLQNKDSERFIAVDWSEEPVRMFETRITVTVNNGKAFWPASRQNSPFRSRHHPCGHGR